MDPLQWMGAVRMRVQTADKNITIHTTPVHQLTSWEDKNCMFVRNKSIIKTFLTSNCCFWLKYKSTINNSTSSREKFISCCLSHQNPATYLFRSVLSCKWCLICADFSPDSDQITFSLEEVLLWIEDSYFS